MWTEGAPLDLEPSVLAVDLQVVVQQLESRLMLYPDPYDACPTEVRKGANAAQLHGECAVLASDTIRQRDDVIKSFLVHVPKEFQRQMPFRWRHPRDLGRLGAQRSDRRFQCVEQVRR